MALILSGRGESGLLTGRSSNASGNPRSLEINGIPALIKSGFDALYYFCLSPLVTKFFERLDPYCYDGILGGLGLSFQSGTKGHIF